MSLAAAPRRRSAASGLVTRLRRLSVADVALLAEASVILALSSAAIRQLSFMQVGRLASRPLGQSHGKRNDDLPAKVAWAVRACARRAPWRAVCFQQGLSAQIMLRRRGVDSTLYFGAAVGMSTGLTAHVWVKAGEVDVVGCEEAPSYVVLAAFPPAPSAAPRAAARPPQPGRFDPIRP